MLPNDLHEPEETVYGNLISKDTCTPDSPGQGRLSVEHEDLCLKLREEIQRCFDELSARFIQEFKNSAPQDQTDFGTATRTSIIDAQKMNLRAYYVNKVNANAAEASITLPATGIRMQGDSELDEPIETGGYQCNSTSNGRDSKVTFTEIPEFVRNPSGCDSDLPLQDDTNADCDKPSEAEIDHTNVTNSALSVASNLRPWRGQIKAVILQHQKNGLQQHVAQLMQTFNRRVVSDGVDEEYLYRLVESQSFTFFSLSIILMNALWMGYEVDHDQGEQGWQNKVNLAFTSWFVAELLLRIIALRIYFFVGQDNRWNILDAFLVLASIPEYFEMGINVSFLRMIRLAKISRAFRLMRFLKLFTSLREIMVSLVSTMGSLFWCFVALVLVSYIFALIFMQSIAFDLEEGVEFDEVTTACFRSTWATMLTLFSMISGGQDWFDFARDFDKNKCYLAKYGLVFYIFFMIFGLCNVVLGVFCAKSTEATLENQDLRLEKEDEKRSKEVQNLMQIFRLIDFGDRGHIEWDQFRTFLKSPRARTMLQAHGLQLFDMDKLWHVMDSYDGCADGKVDMPGFVMGIMRLSGETISTDLFVLAVQVEELREAMQYTSKLSAEILQAVSSSPNAPAGPSMRTFAL